METSGTCMPEREMSLPLSAAQLGLWFAQKLDPTNPIFNEAHSIEIHGPIDANLFRMALAQAVAETEACRVRFVEEIDGPRQIIDPPPEISVPLLDVSAEPDPQAAAESWMRDDLAKPVDILSGPLFFFALFKAAPARFFWYERYHHILIDGFGAALFDSRVAEIYTALVNKVPASANPFSSLSLLVREDQAYRASERFTRDRQYWLECLTDRPDTISLSGKRPTDCRKFLRKTAYVPPSSVEALRSVARHAQGGLPQFMLAATALYLHRLTSARDLVLGLPVTARLGAVARSTPGMLSNVLPLRLMVRPNANLVELMQQVAQQIRRGLLHQRYRTEDLRRDLGLLANGERLFSTSVNIILFDYDLSFAGNAITVHNLSHGPLHDLSIAVYDRPESRGLRIDFDANPGLYTDEAIGDLHQRFFRFLEAIIGDPGRPITRVDVLAPKERHQILVDWNATACEVPLVTLPALFEAQVKRSPQAAALIFEESTLSYAQLNTQANRLGHWLIARGIGPESFVALALPRSTEMVVGLLAILKAGAAYLPLDPDYPAQRLAYMLQDAQPACVLTSAAFTQHLPESPVRFLLDAPETVREMAQQPETDPSSPSARSTPPTSSIPPAPPAFPRA
jgi:nonribosomal peptide synthetase DhbF